MTKKKRYSSLIMLFEIGKLIKNYFLLALLLFVINAGSTSAFAFYGRIVLLIGIGFTLWSILYKWVTHQYELDEKSFHLYRGLFSKSVQTIPFSKIQNVNRHASFFHRLFKMTSLHFETGMTGLHATISFDVISKNEADRMETYVSGVTEVESEDVLETEDDAGTIAESVGQTSDMEQHDRIRKIHFRPTKKDTLKASFTSLSFLVLIPLIGSLYFKLSELFRIEEQAEGILEKLIGTWWIVALIVVILLIASTLFGIMRTFLKYGKYEISSDADHIYIKRGVIDESAFSISKEKVQAIEIVQPLMKRLLGLAEVKLISAGNSSSSGDMPEVNSLYPFLPVEKAYDMLADILPSYEITEEMGRLPKKSFWLRMLRPSWFWLIVTAALFYFKPTILNMEQAWIIISGALLLWILIARWLDFLHTRYTMNDQFIQFENGVLTTTLFISKREKVIEVKVTRNIVQKALGLASIETINRSKPVHHASVDDVPVAFAHAFFHWYKERKQEITIE